MDNDTFHIAKNTNKQKKVKKILSSIGKKFKTFFPIIVIILLIIYFLFSAPRLNKDVTIHISPGENIKSISIKLKERKAIKNDFFLRLFIIALQSKKGVISGGYLIEKDTPVWQVAWQLVKGDHKIDQIKIVFREGLNNNQMADILGDKIPSFRRDLFYSKTADKQGFLFPDTYFFFPEETNDEIVNKLLTNFNNKTKNLFITISQDEIKNIIKMASILEGEASGEEDIYIISGILWKRLRIGMLLQVDVDKNTYVEKGLPERPINNPSLLSIKAALNPIDSPYLYYIHDRNGKIYYAKNYEEHQRNINNYLRK
jgi:UPF0755 protein